MLQGWGEFTYATDMCDANSSSLASDYAIDIAEQSVLYDLYSTTPEGHSPECEGLHQPYGTLLPCYAICPKGKGVCASL